MADLSVELFGHRFHNPVWPAAGPTVRNGEMILRQVYGGLLINGPFTIIVAREGEMIGLTDRIRLRPLTAATRGDRLYLSSEEAPIRLIDRELDRVWTPVGGEPVIGRLGMSLKAKEAAARPLAAAAD